MVIIAHKITLGASVWKQSVHKYLCMRGDILELDCTRRHSKCAFNEQMSFRILSSFESYSSVSDTLSVSFFILQVHEKNELFIDNLSLEKSAGVRFALDAHVAHVFNSCPFKLYRYTMKKGGGLVWWRISLGRLLKKWPRILRNFWLKSAKHLM